MPKYLLDTHRLIWFIDGNKKLSKPARQLIETGDASNFVSIATIWEIAIKLSLGKLEIKIPFREINRHLLENGFSLLPITFEDTLIISDLPFYHRDPFDRVIIAQSYTNQISIITNDEYFSLYEVDVLW